MYAIVVFTSLPQWVSMTVLFVIGIIIPQILNNYLDCLVAAVIISRLGSSPALLREIDGELDAFLRYEVQTVESQTV